MEKQGKKGKKTKKQKKNSKKRSKVTQINLKKHFGRQRKTLQNWDIESVALKLIGRKRHGFFQMFEYETKCDENVL